MTAFWLLSLPRIWHWLIWSLRWKSFLLKKRPVLNIYFSTSLRSLLLRKVLLDLSLCCNWLLLSSLQLVTSWAKQPASHFESLGDIMLHIWASSELGAYMHFFLVENLRHESASTGARVKATTTASATWGKTQRVGGNFLATVSRRSKPQHCVTCQGLCQQRPAA